MKIEIVGKNKIERDIKRKLIKEIALNNINYFDIEYQRSTNSYQEVPIYTGERIITIYLRR